MVVRVVQRVTLVRAAENTVAKTGATPPLPYVVALLYGTDGILHGSRSHIHSKQWGMCVFVMLQFWSLSDSQLTSDATYKDRDKHGVAHHIQ